MTRPKLNPARPDTHPVHGQTTTDPSSSSSPSASHLASARARLATLASHLLPDSALEQTFDYVIVGGGTAGAVLADRLSEDANVSVAVIEGGPSDVGLDEVLDLSRWLELLGSDLDYDYPTTEQPRGNSHIRHSRAKVLGGCSSHNTLISFRPLNADLDDWAQHRGCPQWAAKLIQPYGDRLKLNIVPVAPQQRNQVVRDWVAASSSALSVPTIPDFNSAIVHREGLDERGPLGESGVGFFNIAYDPYDGSRSSASVAYLHPIMDRGPHRRGNLHLFLETWAHKLNFDQYDVNRVRSVSVRTKHGLQRTITARREVLLCAGAIDTPRLMLLSGIGPKKELEALGVPTKHDLPGVGENLQDHPETIIIWETKDTPPETVMSSDAGLFLRTLPHDTEEVYHPGPDTMLHCYQIPFCDNTRRAGYPVPPHAFCMTPNITRSRGRGKLSLKSANPDDKPLLNFRYFEDPDGYDARILVEGLKVARRIAAQTPFKEHLLREVAPGPSVQTDEELDAYARKVAHTVYHPVGTCRMGTPGPQDRLVVVDQRDLRVVGLRGVRVVDASVMPTIPTINPMLTVLQIAERAADIIRQDAWEHGARRTHF